MLFVKFGRVFIRANSKCPSVVTLITGSIRTRWISKRKRAWRNLLSWLLCLPAKLITLSSNPFHPGLAIGSSDPLSHHSFDFPPLADSYSLSKMKDSCSDKSMFIWLCLVSHSLLFSHSPFNPLVSLLLFFPSISPSVTAVKFL